MWGDLSVTDQVEQFYKTKLQSIRDAGMIILSDISEDGGDYGLFFIADKEEIDQFEKQPESGEPFPKLFSRMFETDMIAIDFAYTQIKLRH